VVVVVRTPSSRGPSAALLAWYPVRRDGLRTPSVETGASARFWASR
jgi:hypothetical protein